MLAPSLFEDRRKIWETQWARTLQWANIHARMCFPDAGVLLKSIDRFGACDARQIFENKQMPAHRMRMNHPSKVSVN